MIDRERIHRPVAVGGGLSTIIKLCGIGIYLHGTAGGAVRRFDRGGIVFGFSTIAILGVILEGGVTAMFT